MAVLGALGGLVTRFAGRLVTAALGWAGILLFGKLPKSRQTILAVITFGSLIWAGAVLGVIWPPLGTILIAAVPLSNRVSQDVARLLMLAVVVVGPLAVGTGLALLDDPAAARGGIAERIGLALRGYLVTPVLAVTIAWLAVYALVRQVRRGARRWSELHVPVVVAEGGYDDVVERIRRAVVNAGLEVRQGAASAPLSLPARLLVKAAGRRSGVLVPRKVAVLRAADLEVTIHPFDVMIAGAKEPIARARAAVAIRLVGTPAHLTTAEESQELEDAIERALSAPPAESRRALADADRRLATETLDPEDWDVLARIRFQVEHERRTAMTGGSEPSEPDRPEGTTPGRDPYGERSPVPAPAGSRADGAGAAGASPREAALSIVALAITVANAVLVLRAAATPPRRRG